MIFLLGLLGFGNLGVVVCDHHKVIKQERIQHDSPPPVIGNLGVVVYNHHKVIKQERTRHDSPTPVIGYLPKIPIGFTFAPSDDELFFYLKNKIENSDDGNNSLNIPEKNIYDFLPQELLDGNKDKDAYFFTPRNKISKNGSSINRSVKEGYGHWRITHVTGYKNCLKFYIGKNRRDSKATDWLMKEYVMSCDKGKVGSSSRSSNMRLDDYAICRIHLHKNTKCTEPTAETDCGCNNSKENVSKGKQVSKIGDHENVRMSADVPRLVHHQEYEDQFTSYNPQFGANKLAHSVMSSSAILNFENFVVVKSEDL
ncbi:hypothetical protein MKW94_026980 [Papaver nudicaule]|uniref:NAC domain-containing protein n=1 Tax=Papaver nudicaule TaxID=74823 RepID=A0AA42AZX7_PAPNU|nr:hypothetical protein [Papaver nudicaule]